MSDLCPGVYDALLTEELRAELGRLPESLRAQIGELSPEDAIDYISRYVGDRVRTALREAFEEHEEMVLQRANTLIRGFALGPSVLQQVLEAIAATVEDVPPPPLVPLSQSALVTNETGINYHAVLRSELRTADRVDLICPFIGNQGLNLIFDTISNFGERLRVLTTTYLGATNQRAVERLAETGAQIKIVYERSEQKTALHAKAWVFHRNSGFTTATIGSSNLSHRALVDGLEWNVRLGTADAPQLLEELRVTFERLWQNASEDTYKPSRDSERLRSALRAEGTSQSETRFFADIRPYPHQQEALDELAYARLEGRTCNLVVAATGTGKTLLAAFDYQRLIGQLGQRPSLLFVAHREDILSQSLEAFRAVLRDNDFGELNVGIFKADQWRHVFASVQSLANSDLVEIAPERFDVVVIDEFHHAEAPTYLRLLEHFRPRQLLGLTATPERTDGRNVIDRFGVPTFELRLWHSLERGLLCPFHYYGIDDQTDLTEVGWRGGRYSDTDLDRIYVECGRSRAALVVRELAQKAANPEAMRAVAFCASIAHSNYMAGVFRDAGWEAYSLHSQLPYDTRRSLVRRFRQGEIRILCTVDLFNEGVDVPEIDTVLFLRPTESATVFIQQLGRGLRNHPDKGALTVLDFVGRQNQQFRLDLRYRALTGLSRTELARAVRAEFPSLPPGSHIRLDRVTERAVLNNLKKAIPLRQDTLIDELRRMSAAGVPMRLCNFLEETGLEAEDIYRGGRSFWSLRHAAGLERSQAPNARRAASFLHVDDRHRHTAYLGALRSGASTESETYARMLAFPLCRTVDLSALEDAVRNEAEQLLEALEPRLANRPLLARDLPFALHSAYSRDEIAAPFRDNPESMRQGTFYVEPMELDLHLVTLRKSERHFSPTTRYHDYLISPDQLHWESQSTTTLGSPTGQRLTQGEGRHLFFIREDKALDGRTSPFVCAGFARPVVYESERPIKITWKLEHAVPDHFYIRFRAAAG